MKKIKLSVGDKYHLESALEINAEMQALLIPLLTIVEKEVDPDTYVMLRAVKRLSMCQYHDLNELNNNFE
ncbi:hypothetical protein Xvie_04044 [Xenorhabdus vietnamensis]|uniref:Uncharacterized protein n=1 Tax=Xenorhabdus vietnamensis TaxID=351656 RepID=A0A1Y2S5Y0_9GAMM|nr:hypothetical protein [Xenorhabdus vietnamensis]OTA14047.1 hypothetical protein Xvie_04044 [Xenorhabdus vietnamensis]